MSRLPEEDDTLGREFLQDLSDTWAIRILSLLEVRGYRFTEMKQRLGAPGNSLTRVLKKLERHGLVTRTERLGVDRRLKYELTELGRSFQAMAAHCHDWIRRNAVSTVDGYRTSASCSFPETANREVGFSATRPPMVLNHAAVVVRDIDESARLLAAIFAIEPPQIVEGSVPVPGVGRVNVRVAWVKFGSFWLNLIEARGEESPYRAFVSKHGPGLHHIGFDTPTGLHEYLDMLTRLGGAWIAVGEGRARHVAYAELDFRSTLGTAVEIFQCPSEYRRTRSAAAPMLANGPVRIASLGVIVPDVAQARPHYAELLGMHMANLRFVHFQYHSREGIRRGRARVGTIRHSRITVHVIEPVDESPFKQAVDRAGATFHHIGLQVGSPLSQVVAELEAIGGRVIIGDPQGGYVQVELSEPLPLVLSLTSTERSPDGESDPDLAQSR